MGFYAPEPAKEGCGMKSNASYAGLGEVN
jgi:hypothetical protein